MRALLCAVALSSVAASALGHVPESVAERAAAPEIIIVHGGTLSKRISIARWNENHHLLLVSKETPLGGPRPAFELALFWGSQWRSYAASPESLKSLRPEQANQSGRLFPAMGDLPAMISVGTLTGIVSDSGLAMLRRYEVPTRIPIKP